MVVIVNKSADKNVGEIEVLHKAYSLIRELGEDERRRVLTWLNDKFSAEESANDTSRSDNDTSELNYLEPITSGRTTRQVDQVLLAAAYLSEQEGTKSYKSSQINDTLKAQGVHIKNITMAMKELIECTPQLLTEDKIANKQKAGKRSFYKLTDAGLISAKKLLSPS